MSPMSGQAPVDGSTLHYEIQGAGNPLVMCHGFSLDLRMRDDHVEAFSRRRTVVIYDLRGFGRSPPGSVPYSHAGDLAALIAHIGLGPVSLIGLSLGGGAAINLAVSRPDLVRAMVVVDPSLGGYPWSPGFVAGQAAVRALAAERGVEAALERWVGLALERPGGAATRSLGGASAASSRATRAGTG